MLVCRDDHALAKRTRAHLAAAGAAPAGVRRRRERQPPAARRRARGAAPAPPVHYEVQRSSTAVGLVAAGVAAAIVPSLAVQPGAYPSLRVVPLGRAGGLAHARAGDAQGRAALARRAGALRPDPRAGADGAAACVRPATRGVNAAACAGGGGDRALRAWARCVRDPSGFAAPLVSARGMHRLPSAPPSRAGARHVHIARYVARAARSPDCSHSPSCCSVARLRIRRSRPPSASPNAAS